MGTPKFYRDHAFSTNGSAVAIAVKLAGEDTHSGVLYLDEDDQACVLHLAFHAELLKEFLPDDWTGSVWAVPVILPERAEAVAALCDLLARVHKSRGLPYALRYAEGAFDIGTGELQLGPGCVGFTCSTFIMGVFRSCRITLLRHGEWRERCGDSARQALLVAMLEHRRRNHGTVSAEHIEAVRTEIGCVRFSPLDVAAAATSDQLPIGFEEAVDTGLTLRGMLLSAAGAQ